MTITKFWASIRMLWNENLFGVSTGRRSGTGVRRGSDLRYDIKITFMEAAFGTETEIDVEKMQACSTFGGSGCKPGTQPVTCKHCHGTGQETRTQGFMSLSTTCQHCQGTRVTIPHPCQECNGTGKVKLIKKVAVTIPPGVDSGSRLRLAGEGETWNFGGPPGDLYVFIHVEPYYYFSRDNNDVTCRIPLSFVQPALGDKITVPTLRGQKTLKIPRGTQPGDVFRLRGEGIPSLRSGIPGDQILQVVIEIPKKLNKKQKSLLKEFAKTESPKLAAKFKKMGQSKLKGENEEHDLKW